MPFVTSRRTGMSYAEMTEIAGGVRELTDTELAMVAGGGRGDDLIKIGAGAIWGLTFGPVAGALAAATTVLLLAGANSPARACPANDTGFQDAPL
jgi:hypothetical protein